MYVGMLVQATQSTGACTWSPQTGMSTTGKRRAVESEFGDLPNCTWEEYCSRHGIQCALKAKTLLLKLAGKLRTSGVEEVPPMYDALGRQNGKEPLICWLWGLEADFIVDDEYLLSVMYEFCRDTNDKDLTQLADEVLQDRRKYIKVKEEVGTKYFGKPVRHLEPDFDSLSADYTCFAP